MRDYASVIPFPSVKIDLLLASLVAVALAAGVPAGAQPAQARAAPQRTPAPPPTHANLDYAPPQPPSSNGHKLDLYIPAGRPGPLPTVIWTGGSAWMADNGKNLAGELAVRLNPAGYAVAGVSIRSSSQVQFPGQLHDIKAAIRWLRANAAKYGLDADHIGIIGDSSGGWTSSMAAVTGDVQELEGSVGVTGVSSRVQAAVAFYPPTNFLTMDAWALEKCSPNAGIGGGPGGGSFCHDGESSPESRLVGCAIQSRPDKVRAASPLQYVSAADPPMMILHGQSDQLVPHNQGEALYMALNKACRDAIFISIPKARHGNWNGFLTDDAFREAATMRSTSAAGCRVVNPTPSTPSWQTVIDFLDRYMKR
jgi:acetyl esterase/lipase